MECRWPGCGRMTEDGPLLRANERDWHWCMEHVELALDPVATGVVTVGRLGTCQMCNVECIWWTTIAERRETCCHPECVERWLAERERRKPVGAYARLKR